MAVGTKAWWRRWPALVAGLVLAAGAGVGIWLGTSSSGPDYTFTTASTGTVEQTVSASGTLEAVNQASVNFSVSGQVTSVSAAVGQQVVAGQTLAQLNTASLQASVAEASANLASDQARLDEDESGTGSSSTGSPSSTGSGGNGSQASAAPSASEIDSDEAQIASAQAQLASAQSNLADATLVAPINGTVVAVDLTVGQNISAGGGSDASAASSSSTSAEIQIQDLSSYEVQASVSASDVGDLKVGDQVDITPSSSTATVFGTVTSIALVPTVTSGVATFPVVIGVTGDPAGLYSGVSANASIIVLQEANVLTVPTSAIHSLGSRSFVYELSAAGKEIEQPVSVGARGSTETQITSGLKSGQRIVLANRSLAIPSSGTSPGSGFRFNRTVVGGGGFGGGGFGGGGFGGGGFGGGGG